MTRSPLSRRSFLAMTTAAAAAGLYARATEAQPPADGAVSLAGRWAFALDPADEGAAAGWHTKPLPADAVI
ncbi:MAG TPA: twin-arginine translocation signal domain-containing protein, partial [Asticcacaulis sp.]